MPSYRDFHLIRVYNLEDIQKLDRMFAKGPDQLRYATTYSQNPVFYANFKDAKADFTAKCSEAAKAGDPVMMAVIKLSIPDETRDTVNAEEVQPYFIGERRGSAKFNVDYFVSDYNIPDPCVQRNPQEAVASLHEARKIFEDAIIARQEFGKLVNNELNMQDIGQKLAFAVHPNGFVQLGYVRNGMTYDVPNLTAQTVFQMAMPHLTIEGAAQLQDWYTRFTEKIDKSYPDKTIAERKEMSFNALKESFQEVQGQFSRSDAELIANILQSDATREQVNERIDHVAIEPAPDFMPDITEYDI